MFEDEYEDGLTRFSALLRRIPRVSGQIGIVLEVVRERSICHTASIPSGRRADNRLKYRKPIARLTLPNSWVKQEKRDPFEKSKGTLSPQQIRRRLETIQMTVQRSHSDRNTEAKLLDAADRTRQVNEDR